MPGAQLGADLVGNDAVGPAVPGGVAPDAVGAAAGAPNLLGGSARPGGSPGAGCPLRFARSEEGGCERPPERAADVYGDDHLIMIDFGFKSGKDGCELECETLTFVLPR